MVKKRKKENRADRNISSFTSHRFRRNIANYHFLIGELAIHHVTNRKAHHMYKHLSKHTANDKRLKKARSASSKKGTIPHL